MNFYFVYSGGGGAGDWGGVNRIWNDHMPKYFKDHLLIKFGDIYFNHKGAKNLIRAEQWENTSSASQWLSFKIQNNVIPSENLILDVGTTKIVNYIDSHNPNINNIQIIEKFDQIVSEYRILDKFCDFVIDSKISNAVTFDIPNPFKVRNQSGNPIRNIFNDSACKPALIDKCVKYANYTHNYIKDESKLLTILPGFLKGEEIINYLDRLSYSPSKLAIGALIDMNNNEFIETIKDINHVLDLHSFKKVHFLGCGGIKKALLIKSTIGNNDNFSVDNTTAYNRVIDGATNGNKSSKNNQSCYIDYSNKKLYRIKPETKSVILSIHRNTDNNLKLYADSQMEDILNSIIEHQSGNSSTFTYNSRAKLIMHNFDVFRHNAS